MAQVQIADVIVPDEFTGYVAENSMVNTALYQSGVLVQNGAIADQLQAGAESFNVPFWSDLAEGHGFQAGCSQVLPASVMV